MDVEKYLNLMLSKEGLKKTSSEIVSLREEREKIEGLIIKHFGDLPVIRYAGSYKKGTMIKRSYDLDITCCFKHEDRSAGETLEEIYNNVKKVLEENYTVNPKKSSLQLKSNGESNHIDVVPGRFIDDSEQDVFLYQSEGEKQRLQTNLDKHVNHIKNSNLTETIKLVKIWKEIYSLDVKTFILELLVVKILAGYKDSDGLKRCFIKFLETTNENINSIGVEDPANSSNDLSGIFNDSVKNILSSTAEKTLNSIKNNRWEDIFGSQKEESEEYKINAINEINQSGDGGRPWLNV